MLIFSFLSFEMESIIIIILLLIALCGLVLAEKGLKYKDNVDLPGFELKEIEGQYRGNFVGFTNSTKTDILASISSVIRAKFFFHSVSE